MKARLFFNRYSCPLLIPAIILAVATGQANADWYKQSDAIMGTRILVELWHDDSDRARQCGDMVFTEMHRIDELMSPYKNSSQLSAINNNAAHAAVPVSSELHDLIEKSLTFSELSAGAFDITFSSIGYHYDYRNHLQPSEQTIEQKLDTINYKNLLLKDNTVAFAKPGMRIDLGGIAKGYAVDRAIAILQHCGIQHALVSAGGDTRILGDRHGRSWMIGIQHPRDKTAVALRIPLTDSAMSTSGDYERFFIAGKERIHHIINPETGRSAKKSWSATVIGPDTTTTDALSTTIFILGATKGIELINTMDGVDAIIIDASGVVHYSSGLENPAGSD
jgi:thiamine biosynthesis lipoprotein